MNGSGNEDNSMIAYTRGVLLGVTMVILMALLLYVIPKIAYKYILEPMVIETIDRKNGERME